MKKQSYYILQQSLNHYFIEISLKNEVVKSNHSLLAMVFDNIYTANSFKTLLFNHYKEKFTVIHL